MHLSVIECVHYFEIRHLHKECRLYTSVYDSSLPVMMTRGIDIRVLLLFVFTMIVISFRNYLPILIYYDWKRIMCQLNFILLEYESTLSCTPCFVAIHVFKA